MAEAQLSGPPAGGPAFECARTAPVSVVVCAYTERRWEALTEAIDSIARQVPAARETIVVVDHNDTLLTRARAAFPGARVVSNPGVRGLSGARNAGIQAATGEIIAFLDDDAAAEDAWLAALTEPFCDPEVIAAGGLAVPAWESARPAWLPEEFLWVVGCSYRGLPDGVSQIRNPIGANMAFRRAVLIASGGFADGIGRVGRLPLGCEETELSIRARALTGGRILHLPKSRVSHRVTVDRLTWTYFRRRCWAEGLSKAAVRRCVGSDSALASERGYVLRTLPSGVLRCARAFLAGEAAGAARAAAIVLGLAITSAGYLWGVARQTAAAVR
jgi:glycosyltransferase involved in cell wall biosynthesis